MLSFTSVWSADSEVVEWECGNSVLHSPHVSMSAMFSQATCANVWRCSYKFWMLRMNIEYFRGVELIVSSLIKIDVCSVSLIPKN